ncbi:helix-turn-helix domain-containing protein [Nocardia sp. NPDC052566]|uniref:helix-turn-helix domain-containing protein n=1 Tax=Nocardia sp. NPDC052566 TaxID=3364330 RepID=UPI0037CC4AB8
MEELNAEQARARLIERVREPAVFGEMIGTVVRVARAASPQVATLPEEETRRHSEVLVGGIITDGDRPGAEVLAAAERLGSERARQGVTAAAVLDGVQASRSCLMRLLLDHGDSLGVPSRVLIDVVLGLDDVSTAVVQRILHAHRETELELARTRTERETQTLRQLLHGEPVVSCAPLVASSAYHCVVSDISDPAHAQQLAITLTSAGPGLCGLVDGRLAALVVQLPTLDDECPLLVSTPAVRPAQVGPLYRLARQALPAGRAAGLAGLRELPGLALLTAIHAQPELGQILTAGLLADLDLEDQFHRDLAETALAYLDHRRRIEPTAATLHIHTNTVKYRLRRFGELTGHVLTGAENAGVVETTHQWWALRHWLTQPSAM